MYLPIYFIYCLSLLPESNLHEIRNFVYFVFLAPRSVPGTIKFVLNEQMNESRKCINESRNSYLSCFNTIIKLKLRK